jgi:hypothetical protein
VNGWLPLAIHGSHSQATPFNPLPYLEVGVHVFSLLPRPIHSKARAIPQDTLHDQPPPALRTLMTVHEQRPSTPFPYLADGVFSGVSSFRSCLIRLPQFSRRRAPSSKTRDAARRASFLGLTATFCVNPNLSTGVHQRGGGHRGEPRAGAYTPSHFRSTELTLPLSAQLKLTLSPI